MSSTLVIVGDPVDNVPDMFSMELPPSETEQVSGRPDDDLQRAAESLGRVNVSYEAVWNAIKEAAGKWVVVRCNSARRAVLLASAATQHRTQAHDVTRRGRMVCIRLMGGLGTQPS